MLPIVPVRMGGNVVSLVGDTVTSIVSHPSSATATLTISGKQVFGDDTQAWLKGGGSPSNYEVEATLNSGTVSGTFGSWLNLGSPQSWSLTESTIGTKLGSVTLQIRPAGGGAVLATATFSFHAEVD